jgi:hypothetical protein
MLNVMKLVIASLTGLSFRFTLMCMVMRADYFGGFQPMKLAIKMPFSSKMRDKFSECVHLQCDTCKLINPR